MKKVVLFPFNGELMCFIHVLLNALDMKEKGFDVGIVVEGAALKLIPEIAGEKHPMHGIYSQCRKNDLFFGACRACSAKLGVLDEVVATGITMLDDMKGHPGMARFIDDGYEVITF